MGNGVLCGNKNIKGTAFKTYEKRSSAVTIFDLEWFSIKHIQILLPDKKYRFGFESQRFKVLKCATLAAASTFFLLLLCLTSN